MAHQVLARKWRPRQFADVVGQDHVVKALANALDNGRLHHAYLFTGTRGVGKTTLARILAKALNCQGADGQGGITSKPCGVCSACTDIDAGRFVDLLEVDAATNTKVDEMRELLETAQYMPVSGRYKVYIIDEVHMLSKSAFNAMLKTLEEPPGHVEFILATTDPQKLPITVLSRCLQFNLKNLPPALIAQHLHHVLEVEKVPCEQPALEMLGRAAEGSVRDALSLLDQAIAYGAGEVKQAQVADMLGALDQGYLISLLQHLVRRDARALLNEIELIARRSISFDMTLKDLAALLSQLALVHAAGEEMLSGQDAAAIAALAKQFSQDDVQLLYQIAILGRRDLALAPDEQSGFTMTLLRMLAFLSPAGQSAVFAPAPGGRMGEPAGPGDNSRAARGTARSAATAAPAPASTPAPAVTGSISRTPAAEHPPWESAPNTAPIADFEASPQNEAKFATISFTGDWPAFVAQINLSGMAAMVARQCEFVSYENGMLTLLVPDAQKHLAEKHYQDKLLAELTQHFGDGLRLSIQIGVPVGSSVSAVERREAAARQAEAETAIAEDPFMRALQQDLGAEVDRSSIRPVLH